MDMDIPVVGLHVVAVGPFLILELNLAEHADAAATHVTVVMRHLDEGWVISARPAHPAIVTEADFIAAQDLAAHRGPDSPAGRCYLLAGLLRCGTCGRLLESCWSNGKPAYRCRHGHTTVTRPDPARPPNAYIREDQILPRLPALGILIGVRSSRKRDTTDSPAPAPAGAAHLISYLRVKGITLIYDPDEHTLRAGSRSPMSVTIDRKTPAARR